MAGCPARAAAFAAVALLSATAAAQQPPLTRTEPGHQPPVPPGGYQLPLAPPITKFPLPPQFVVIRSTQDWRKAGKVDKDLSRACANRQFTQLFPMQYRAIFQTDVLGVAFGHGTNLRDPGKLADKKKIYLFRNGDSTACVVLAMDNQDVRLLNDNPAPGDKQGAAASRPRLSVLSCPHRGVRNAPPDDTPRQGRDPWRNDCCLDWRSPPRPHGRRRPRIFRCASCT